MSSLSIPELPAALSPAPSEQAEAAEEPPERATPASADTAAEAVLLASPLGALAGVAIALLSLAVPLASVISDRQDPAPAGMSTSLRR